MEDPTLWEKINQLADSMPLGWCFVCGALAVLVVVMVTKKWITG